MNDAFQDPEKLIYFSHLAPPPYMPPRHFPTFFDFHDAIGKCREITRGGGRINSFVGKRVFYFNFSFLVAPHSYTRHFYFHTSSENVGKSQGDTFKKQDQQKAAKSA